MPWMLRHWLLVIVCTTLVACRTPDTSVATAETSVKPGINKAFLDPALDAPTLERALDV